MRRKLRGHKKIYLGTYLWKNFLIYDRRLLPQRQLSEFIYYLWCKICELYLHKYDLYKKGIFAYSYDNASWSLNSNSFFNGCPCQKNLECNETGNWWISLSCIITLIFVQLCLCTTSLSQFPSLYKKNCWHDYGTHKSILPHQLWCIPYRCGPWKLGKICLQQPVFNTDRNATHFIYKILFIKLEKTKYIISSLATSLGLLKAISFDGCGQTSFATALLKTSYRTHF